MGHVDTPKVILGQVRRIYILISVFSALLIVVFAQDQDKNETSVVNPHPVNSDLVVPSTRKFLRSNLIPEYFKGVLYQSQFNPSYLTLLSSDCLLDFERWISEINNNYEDIGRAENWALKMIDAWGKPPEGLLSGHINSMGDFDECLSVRVVGKRPFIGKYCTNHLVFSNAKVFQNVTGNLTLGNDVEKDPRSVVELLSLLDALSKTEHPVSPTVASCLPSSCTTSDIQIITEAVFNASESTSSMRPLTGQCYTDEKPPLSAGSIVMIVVLGILALLCLIGSTLDLLHRYQYLHNIYPNPELQINTRLESRPHNKIPKSCQILIAFSIPRNTEKLLSTKVPPNSFGCLHGIRFLSAVWVVLGHTFYMHILQSTWNLVDIAQAPVDNLLTLFIVNGGVVVDTFLTITGVLVAFNILKQLELRHGKLNIPLLYLNRYLRLTPLYAFLIGILATLLPYFNSGPKWFIVEAWSQYCQKNWWHNLLYFNNLNIYDSVGSPTTNKQCFGEAWYLAVDMQLFLISPLLIYPLWRWEKVGIALLSLTTLASIIVPGTVTYTNHLPPTALPFTERGNFTNESYMVPWMRAAPYLMGMWCGYFLYKTRRMQSFKLPRLLVLSCWAITVSSALAVVLGIQKYFDYHYKVPQVEGAIYSGFYHAIWGIALAWIIFACSRGYGGWVNRFLGWKVFVPLGRLTYAIYLVSLNVQFILHFSYRQAIYYSMYHALNLAFAHIMMSCLVAFVISITMEAPFMELEKIFFRKKTHQQESENGTKTVLNNGQEYRRYGTA